MCCTFQEEQTEQIAWVGGLWEWQSRKICFDSTTNIWQKSNEKVFCSRSFSCQIWIKSFRLRWRQRRRRTHFTSSLGFDFNCVTTQENIFGIENAIKLNFYDFHPSLVIEEFEAERDLLKNWHNRLVIVLFVGFVVVVFDDDQRVDFSAQKSIFVSNSDDNFSISRVSFSICVRLARVNFKLFFLPSKWNLRNREHHQLTPITSARTN